MGKNSETPNAKVKLVTKEQKVEEEEATAAVKKKLEEVYERIKAKNFFIPFSNM